MRERIEAEIAETQRPKVHFKMHLCHGGIKGNVLTAESTILEVLSLWNSFEAVRQHVEVLIRLQFILIWNIKTNGIYGLRLQEQDHRITHKNYSF